MKKYLFMTLTFYTILSLASDFSEFQNFDNVINIGIGTQKDESTNVNGLSSNTATFTTYTLQGQRILNMGIYIDVLANLTDTSNKSPSAINYYGINGKLGYSFQVANDHLLIIPYLYSGLNNNGLFSYNLGQGTVNTNSNASNLYYFTVGFGERFEYRINKYILLYADQNFLYNIDQSPALSGTTQPQNYNSFISSVGAKFNLVDLFQLGVMGFYTNYQSQSSNVPISGSSALAISQPQSSAGGMVTIGLTY